MWFTSKKIPTDIVESRLFEFKGAVQTCDINVIKFSLNVLCTDLPDSIKDSPFFKEIMNFESALSKGGSARKILYNAFENLLTSTKIKKEVKLNDLENMPHGFSCPENCNFENINFIDYWTDTKFLKLYLEEVEINLRTKKFSEFLLDENYSDDILNDIKWHESDLTSDLVSGCKFAGDAARSVLWEEFGDSIMKMRKLTFDEKNIAIDKFSKMIANLPFNNFKK
jgi:hypothetical protein